MSDGCVSLLTDALGRPVRISADFLNMPSPTVFRIGTGEISEKGKWLLEEMKSRTPVKVKEIPQRNLLDILLGR